MPQFTASATLCVVAAIMAWVGPLPAAVRPKLVVLAVDESSSMAKSDPARMRIEAASMVLSIASPQDQVGVIGFGDTARWAEKPREPGAAMTDSVQRLGQSNRHTEFHPAIALFSDFLDRQDQTYRNTHEAVLILFTDGRSEPADGSAAEDRSKSLQLARGVRGRGAIHVVSLGREVDRDFLDSLAGSQSFLRNTVSEDDRSNE
jgi:Mg-chelatase subunit ChlD